MDINDTIVAISTPPGEGGIGIVRISGSIAGSIMRKVFRGKEKNPGFKSHQLYHGTIYDAAKELHLDECLVVVMYGPRSFTGEDVVEFHCHGGRLLLRRVLELVTREGARLSEPGEFTKRAFLNGKMDLVQAEAVIDLISAKTDLALEVAWGQLKGSISRRVDEIGTTLFKLLAKVEASLDFPDEEDVLIAMSTEVEEVLDKAQQGIKELLETYEEGRIIKDGITTVISGRPNVGKSTLLNVLLKEERAIVTPLPGTTRDIIEEVVHVKGMTLRLMDTAGLRDTKDSVEAIGVNLARERIKVAQLVLYMVDAGCDPREDLEFLSKTKGQKIIVVVNKVDLIEKEHFDRLTSLFDKWTVVGISALNQEGIDCLEEAISRETIMQAGGEIGTVLLTNVRQKITLKCVCASLERAKDTIKMGLSGEFVSLELRDAVERIGEITGKVTTEDILDNIFNQFCIGK